MRFCLAFIAATAAIPALAAPPAVDGDAYEILGVALGLAAKCENMRGFEYLYLAEAWTRHEAGSAVKADADAARDRASGDILNKEMAVQNARQRHADAWRTKAEALGCEGGHNYLLQGMILSYKNLGSVMAIALASRHAQPGNPAPLLPPLEDYQTAAIRAFDGQAAAFFGEEKAQFDALLPRLAQERMAGYTTYAPSLTLSEMIDDQRRAFAIIHHESLANNAGWTLRGTTIPDGTPFGYRTMRLSRNGAPPLSLIAAPVEVTITAPGWPKSVRAYLAIGVRPDGTVIAGLGGGNLHDAPASVTVKAQAPGNPIRRVATGQATKENCPYARCFAFPRDTLVQFTGGIDKVRFYAATHAGAEPQAADIDGTDIDPLRLKVATSQQ